MLLLFLNFRRSAFPGFCLNLCVFIDLFVLARKLQSFFDISSITLDFFSTQVPPGLSFLPSFFCNVWF